MGERKDTTEPHPRRHDARRGRRRLALTAASGGKASSGQLCRWAMVLHHGTNVHGIRKVLGCTDQTGGQTDPAMEAPDPPDPPVWASASKEDRADKPTSMSVPDAGEGRGGGRRERAKLKLRSGRVVEASGQASCISAGGGGGPR